MRIFSRRTFVKRAGMCVALGELLLSGEKMLHANPLGLSIGCQTWPVRSMIAKDFPGTLKQLSAAKYGRPKGVVEQDIMARMATKEPPKPTVQRSRSPKGRNRPTAGST